MALFANSGDPDQTPRFAVSDLGLHCLPDILLGVSRLKWVNNSSTDGLFTVDDSQLILSPSAILSIAQENEYSEIF